MDRVTHEISSLAYTGLISTRMREDDFLEVSNYNLTRIVVSLKSLSSLIGGCPKAKWKRCRDQTRPELHLNIHETDSNSKSPVELHLHLHVLHSVVKENKIHDRIDFIVVIQRFSEEFVQRVPALYR